MGMNSALAMHSSWWGVATHQHVLCNLSKILIIIANDTATSLANQQKNLSSSKSSFRQLYCFRLYSNWAARGMMTINSSCCTLAQVEPALKF